MRGGIRYVLLALLLLGAMPASAAPARVLRDVAYESDGNPAHRLDLYLPAREGGKVPLIVWVHGGGWQMGSKAHCPIRFMASRGYAIASVEYRLSREAVFPAQIEDCKAAVRWLRAHAERYGFDPRRIGAWGGSAGGHLVALLGTSAGVGAWDGGGGNAGVSSRVQAVCDWFGPVDLTSADWRSPIARQAITALLGATPRERPELAREANPITWIHPGLPPFFIAQGDRDPLVPVSQSRKLYQALRGAGDDVTLLVVPGRGHGDLGPGAVEASARFFERHL